MLTTRSITQNITHGQQSIPLKHILKGLDAFYEKVKSKLQISYVNQDMNGSYVYFKVPSEDKPIYYDVVIWFKNLKKTSLDTELKVYSNSPHFGYNFVYVFNQNQSLLFPSNYGNTFISNPPTTRNPFQTAGFDKHVYAALKYSYKLDLESATAFFVDKPKPKVLTFRQMEIQLKSLTKKSKKRT